MTKQEESRIFTGRWPWELPGVKVVGEGIAVCDIPKYSSNPDRRRSEIRKFREQSNEFRREAMEEVEGFSRSELQATIEMTRDELALRWAKLKSTGEKVEDRFGQFKEWIAERLRDNHRDDPEGAEHPFSDLLWVHTRIGVPERHDQWQHVFGRSHLTGIESVRALNRHIRSFNEIAGRYSGLRLKRFSVAVGGSGTGDYDPSPAARKALSTVARLDREHDGLAEMDIRDVWDYVEEEVVGLVNARANVRQDMRGRNKAPGRYPKDTEELLELAREVAGERSQTFANRPKP
jgi:hypothetical protein